MRINWLGSALVAAAIASGGCDSTTGGGDFKFLGDDAGEKQDLFGVIQDFQMPDLMPGSKQKIVYWSLITANIQGGSNNGFSLKCGEAMPNAVTQLLWTVVNDT